MSSSLWRLPGYLLGDSSLVATQQLTWGTGTAPEAEYFDPVSISCNDRDTKHQQSRRVNIFLLFVYHLENVEIVYPFNNFNSSNGFFFILFCLTEESLYLFEDKKVQYNKTFGNICKTLKAKTELLIK